MRNEESEFSSLRTVSSFDKGDTSTVAIDLTEQENLQCFTPSSLLVETLIEQLCSFMEKDPHIQKELYLTICQKLHQMNLICDTYKSSELQFIRSHYRKALYHLIASTKSTTVDNRIFLPKPKGPLSLTTNNVVDCSRYLTEFQEIEYIAHGGFGHVYKAEHKLDGSLYAVKKICLRCRSINDFLENLKEVKMLAKLNHPNIVAYKAAWLEPMEKQKKAIDAPVEVETKSINDDSLEVIFEASDNENNALSSEKASSEFQNSSNSSLSNKAVCEYKRNGVYKFGCNRTTVSHHSQRAMLYIQMQLCHKTLRQWLDERNESNGTVDIEKCSDIFKQVVRGIEYIHSQGIVHHDIKPSNIFVSDDLRQVQVGDFGLACYLLAHQSPTLEVVTTTHQPGQVGTKLYAAPEQLSGICHPKSDIYSLGIVLFELIQPFKTSMERSKVITQLKSGHMPTELAASHHFLVKIISQTVNGLKTRPTSTELSNSLEEAQNNSTQSVISSLTRRVELLRKESLEKDEEIASLKQQLEEALKRNH